MAFVIASDGAKLYAEIHEPPIRESDRGLGFPLLLSCGLNTTHENWRPQVEAFTQAGVRVILWDYRGHGSSESPDDPDAYSMSQVVDDLGRVLDWAAPGEPAVLGGLSFGGLASLHFCLENPERVRALLLIDSGPGFKKPEAQARWEARIARELHDVLGHTLNLVVIQAGAAQRVFKSAPDKALEAVRSIETTSRQALSDVDRMLGILRDPDDPDRTSLIARPSMTRLDALVDDLRNAGQKIDLDISGPPSTLPPSIDLSVYRVVQEALTNVMTHASGARARVDIKYSEEFLDVTISNDGSGVEKVISRSGGGRGIVGMRERTALFGGEFEAGRSNNGGWRVHAVFPIGGSR